MMNRDVVLHLLDLAEEKANELARLYADRKRTCGSGDLVAGEYMVRISINNRAIIALKNEGVH